MLGIMKDQGNKRLSIFALMLCAILLGIGSGDTEAAPKRKAGTVDVREEVILVQRQKPGGKGTVTPTQMIGGTPMAK